MRQTEQTPAMGPLNLVRREKTLIVAFVAVAAVLLGIVHLGSEIGEGDSFAFDNWLLLALRQPGQVSSPAGPGWLREAFVDITALGGTTVLTLITVASAGYLVAARKYGNAAFLALAVISGSILGKLLKYVFARPRPDIVSHLVNVNTVSFPSGHSVNSAVVFLTLGALLARSSAERRTRIYVLATAMILTLLIGFSRVYTGVHWPTDVLAGWAVGGSWALLCWTILHRLQRSGDLERSAPRPSSTPARIEGGDEAI